MLHRKLPCEECPWRRDTEPGQFPAERYEALRATSCTEGGHPGLGDPMFACHKSQEGREVACAGWLAVEGAAHVRVRIALATGELPAEATRGGADWPVLFDSYDEMAETQGRDGAT